MLFVMQRIKKVDFAEEKNWDDSFILFRKLKFTLKLNSYWNASVFLSLCDEL